MSTVRIVSRKYFQVARTRINLLTCSPPDSRANSDMGLPGLPSYTSGGRLEPYRPLYTSSKGRMKSMKSSGKVPTCTSASNGF